MMYDHVKGELSSITRQFCPPESSRQGRAFVYPQQLGQAKSPSAHRNDPISVKKQIFGLDLDESLEQPRMHLVLCSLEM
jgi:hypothetical protein